MNNQSWRREKGRRASGFSAVHTRIMEPTQGGWRHTCMGRRMRVGFDSSADDLREHRGKLDAQNGRLTHLNVPGNFRTVLACEQESQQHAEAVHVAHLRHLPWARRATLGVARSYSNATKRVTGMERCQGNRTSTQPWPSRCTNSSGAMYAGVPRGGVLTLPQPRPVGRGMARRASPKSLIFADTEVEPSGSMFVTHSTWMWITCTVTAN